MARVPQVGVLIDYHTIRAGLHAHSICELDNGTPIPVSAARRLCCDANVFPIVLAGNGEALGGRLVSDTKRSSPGNSTFGDGNVWCLTPNVRLPNGDDRRMRSITTSSTKAAGNSP